MNEIPSAPPRGFSPERCVGCGACVAACLVQHAALPGSTALRRLFRKEDEEALEWYSVSCVHCQAHPCLAACPMKCFSLDEVHGLVALDSARCIGCRACQRACPHMGIVFDGAGKAQKCDGCASRLDAGLPPACMASCPVAAITDTPGAPVCRAEDFQPWL